MITNSLGEVISRRDFQPFGEEIKDDSQVYRKTTDKYGLADSVRQRFTGYQKDDETGLDFAEARMYENRHGRFTAVDPLLTSGKSANPQTFNRYVYVMNNPLAYTDPSGLQAGAERRDVYVNADQTSFTNYAKEGYTRYKGGPIRVSAQDGYDYRITSNGWRSMGKTKPNAADVVTQAVKDTVVGVGGTFYNLSAGTTNLIFGAANRANLQYFSTGVPRDEFPTYDYVEMVTPGEQAASAVTTFGLFYFGAASAARNPAPSFSGFSTSSSGGSLGQGSATINYFDLPTGPHFSVRTQIGGTSLESDQIITNAQTRLTTIRETTGLPPPTNSVTVLLPNARAAMQRQNSLFGQNTGVYNSRTNSCVTHVCDILSTGGLNAPNSTGRGVRYFQGLGMSGQPR